MVKENFQDVLNKQCRHWMKEQRELHGLDRKGFAEKVGYNYQHIVYLENGNRNFNLNNCALFSEFFGADIQITFKKGEFDMQISGFNPQVVEESIKVLEKTTTNSAIEELFPIIDKAVECIENDTEHYEMEVHLNQVYDELNWLGYDTDYVEKAKISIVTDFVQGNEFMDKVFSGMEKVKSLCLVHGDLTSVSNPSLVSLIDTYVHDLLRTDGWHESIYSLSESLTQFKENLKTFL